MKQNNNVLKRYYYRKRYIFKNIKQFFRNLKYAWQRITRGYADCDVWDFDKYLYSIIQGGLVQLAETTMGYPEQYSNFESWHDELNRIAELINLLDIDNLMDDCFDENENFDRDKYRKLCDACELHKQEFFNWLKENIDRLWD